MTIVVRQVTMESRKPTFEIKVPGSYWKGGYSFRYIRRTMLRNGHAYVSVHECGPGLMEFDIDDPTWGDLGKPGKWVKEPHYRSHKLMDSRSGAGPGVFRPLKEVMKFAVDVEVR